MAMSKEKEFDVTRMIEDVGAAVRRFAEFAAHEMFDGMRALGPSEIAFVDLSTKGAEGLRELLVTFTAACAMGGEQNVKRGLTKKEEEQRERLFGKIDAAFYGVANNPVVAKAVLEAHGGGEEMTPEHRDVLFEMSKVGKG